MEADDECPYTRPTGEGYVGVWQTQGWFVTIPIGAISWIDWPPGEEIAVIDDGQTNAVALTAAPEPGTRGSGPAKRVATVRVGEQRGRSQLRVGSDTLAALAAFEPGSEVRGYQRAPRGLYLVPVSNDPFIGVSRDLPSNSQMSESREES